MCRKVRLENVLIGGKLAMYTGAFAFCVVLISEIIDAARPGYFVRCIASVIITALFAGFFVDRIIYTIVELFKIIDRSIKW